MRAICLVAMLGLMPMIGLAQDGSAAGNDPQPQAKAPADDTKLVCERKKALGSHRPERVCKTQAEWDAERAKAQADLQRYGRCSGNDNPCVAQP
jgi:hypothetical protein